MPEQYRDLQFTDSGDIEIDETGDLKLSDPERTAIQDIQFRVASQHFDYAPEPMIGANLVQFQGKPRGNRLIDAIKEAIWYSLTKDGRFGRSNIGVEVLPLSKDTVAVYVFLYDYVEGRLEKAARNESPLTISFILNVETGYITGITGVEA